MARFGGTDEVVVRKPEQLHHSSKLSGVFIRERLRRNSSFARALLHLRAVLICASQKENFATIEPLRSCPHIAERRCVCVTDVRTVIHVVNGRRDGNGRARGEHEVAIVRMQVATLPLCRNLSNNPPMRSRACLGLHRKR